MRGYYGYKPRKKPVDIDAQLAKLRKKNPDIKPVILEGKKLAKTWWAQAWNENLENYADYSNRIGRGRSYVRSGAVLDLAISSGEVNALVQGTRAKPYEVTIRIKALSAKKWDKIVGHCGHKIGSLEELTQGNFPQEFMELFVAQGEGLFPSPKDIQFHCACPDWAYMCKHVAAVLYGIGARFDEDATLFFTLREIDFTHFLKKSIEEKMNNMLKNAGKRTHRVMQDANTKELFGV